MLPKKNRLTKREDFSIVYSKGSYIGQDGIVIKYLQTNLTESRIGFSIGKNFSKKAVQRNRARRVLRETCRLSMTLIKPGFDIVIMIKLEYKDIEFKKIGEVLRQIFTKANLFK